MVDAVSRQEGDCSPADLDDRERCARPPEGRLDLDRPRSLTDVYKPVPPIIPMSACLSWVRTPGA